MLIHRDARVANGVQVAELAERFLARGFARPTGVDETPNAHVQVKGELVVHVAIDVGFERNSKNAPHDNLPRYATDGEAAANAFPTARAYRSHEETSARSCWRPARLSS